MNVSVEKLPESRVSLRIEIPPEEVRPYLERAARGLAKERPPKGFRPGAVPFAVMRSTLGDQPIVERALKELVPKTYVETLLDREDIEAIGQPEVTVEQVAVDAPCVYRAAVAVLPEVQLWDYHQVKAERRVVSVDEAEITRELEYLQRARASYLSVTRAAQLGDRVEAAVRAMADRVPLEVGAPPHVFLLGEEQFIPGFEEHLRGMKEGEAKQFTLTVPEQHHRLDLRGKKIEFQVTVRLVQQRVLPALDDAFARGLGTFASLGELKDRLAANLRIEKEELERERVRQELLRQVVERTTYGALPEALVERELDGMLAELEEGVTSMGLPFDVYLTQAKQDRSTLRGQWREKALERLRASLALREIARAENITVTDEDVEEEVNHVLKTYPSLDGARKQVDLAALRDLVSGKIRNRKVLACLERFAAAG